MWTNSNLIWSRTSSELVNINFRSVIISKPRYYFITISYVGSSLRFGDSRCFLDNFSSFQNARMITFEIQYEIPKVTEKTSCSARIKLMVVFGLTPKLYQNCFKIGLLSDTRNCTNRDAERVLIRKCINLPVDLLSARRKPEICDMTSEVLTSF